MKEKRRKKKKKLTYHTDSLTTEPGPNTGENRKKANKWKKQKNYPQEKHE